MSWKHTFFCILFRLKTFTFIIPYSNRISWFLIYFFYLSHKTFVISLLTWISPKTFCIHKVKHGFKNQLYFIRNSIHIWWNTRKRSLFVEIYVFELWIFDSFTSISGGSFNKVKNVYTSFLVTLYWSVKLRQLVLDYTNLNVSQYFAKMKPRARVFH